jgi:hypothetical protein
MDDERGLVVAGGEERGERAAGLRVLATLDVA